MSCAPDQNPVLHIASGCPHQTHQPVASPLPSRPHLLEPRPPAAPRPGPPSWCCSRLAARSNWAARMAAPPQAHMAAVLLAAAAAAAYAAAATAASAVVVAAAAVEAAAAVAGPAVTPGVVVGIPTHRAVAQRPCGMVATAAGRPEPAHLVAMGAWSAAVEAGRVLVALAAVMWPGTAGAAADAEEAAQKSSHQAPGSAAGSRQLTAGVAEEAAAEAAAAARAAEAAAAVVAGGGEARD
mmetsp:Transcript_79927/g.158859  ORF Transcript_79927/g.158859 Transcript_79927/m.158859 type:complete len:239 (-) Transcript_79927:717-1433(-)